MTEFAFDGESLLIVYNAIFASTNSFLPSRGKRGYNLWPMPSVLVSSMTWVVAATWMSV